MGTATANLWKPVAINELDRPATVQVSGEAGRVLEDVKAELGVAKGELVSRLVLWFSKLQVSTKVELIRDGDVTGELVRIRLAETATGGESAGAALDVDEAARLARTSIDRLEHLAKQYKRDLSQRLGPKTKSS